MEKLEANGFVSAKFTTRPLIQLDEAAVDTVFLSKLGLFLLDARLLVCHLLFFDTTFSLEIESALILDGIKKMRNICILALHGVLVGPPLLHNLSDLAAAKETFVLVEFKLVNHSIDDGLYFVSHFIS